MSYVRDSVRWSRSCELKVLYETVVFAMAGICARCKKGNTCGFRQPGTWVDECALFKLKVRTSKDKVLPDWLEIEASTSVGKQIQSDIEGKGRDKSPSVTKKTENPAYVQKFPPA
jgi:hypothetical protein